MSSRKKYYGANNPSCSATSYVQHRAEKHVEEYGEPLFPKVIGLCFGLVLALMIDDAPPENGGHGTVLRLRRRCVLY
jgi:hypothetical protein